jgi:hypothetical protein
MRNSLTKDINRKLKAMAECRNPDHRVTVLRYIHREPYSKDGNKEILISTDGHLLLSFTVDANFLGIALRELEGSGWRTKGTFIAPPRTELPDDDAVYPDWRRVIPEIRVGLLHECRYKAFNPANQVLAARFLDRETFIPNFYCQGPLKGVGFADPVEGFAYLMPLPITDSMEVQLIDPVSACPWIRKEDK